MSHDLPSDADRGDTLVEILVALAILATAVVSLVGALGTNVTTSVANRSQAKAESALLAASEHVKSLSFTPAQFACTGGTPTALSTAVVPRDAAFAVTYGPPQAVGTTPCSKIVRVPVTVTGDGYTLSVDVVKRP